MRALGLDETKSSYVRKSKTSLSPAEKQASASGQKAGPDSKSPASTKKAKGTASKGKAATEVNEGPDDRPITSLASGKDNQGKFGKAAKASEPSAKKSQAKDQAKAPAGLVPAISLKRKFALHSLAIKTISLLERVSIVVFS